MCRQTIEVGNQILGKNLKISFKLEKQKIVQNVKNRLIGFNMG